MNSEVGPKRPIFVAITAFSFCSIFFISANSQDTPHAKVLALDSGGKDYLQVLGRPPESLTMKSGLVVLTPGKSVGKHRTGQHEELLVVLEGQGEMSFKDGSKLDVKANHARIVHPRQSTTSQTRGAACSDTSTSWQVPSR